MAVEVLMPKFGLTMHEGTIQRFFKAPGDEVRAGEPLYEVETEKVLYEVEAPASGILALWLFDAEATVECGRAVGVIAEPGEELELLAARYGPGRAPGAAPSAQQIAEGARAAAAAAAAPAAAAGERRPISPVARKLAAELGVDLDKVKGSGPGGRVTREDVERAAAAARAGAPALAAAPKPAGAPRIVPLRGMRKTIAERMHLSLQQAAQLTITVETDVTPAVEFRARSNRDSEFTYTDMIIHAVARALLRHPRLNARLTEGGIAILPEVNVGMAVALEEGLIVPVIFDAACKTLRQIGAESKALGEKARAGQLKLEDVTGGTFTVSNLGVYGVDAFTPIINPGETAILGVGRIVEKPAVYRGEIARRSMMMLSLTFDHRLIDGAPAAAFLQSVIDILNYGER